MRKKLYTMLAVLSVVFIIAGCSGGSDEGKKKEGTGDEKQVLEISVFEGGHGSEIWEKTIEQFEKQHGNVEVKANISPENHETLRINILEGNPPDLYFANSAMLDNYRLIDEGQLSTIDSLINEEIDGGETISDMLIPSIKEGFTIDDSMYLMPFDILVFGQFYDEQLFEDHDVTIPENIDEYIEVGQTLANSDIDMFTYPGVVPVYLTWSFVPTVGSIGGPEALAKIENIEEGAWSQPAVVEALERIERLRDEDLIQNGVLAFDHTQAQMEFINHRAATIVTGSWLENEMEGNWPEDFNLKFLGTPWNEADESPFISFVSSVLAIPEEAKNKELAMEFVQFMYSDENMELWAKEAGIVRPIQDVSDYSEYLPDSVVDAMDALNDPDIVSHVQLFTDRYAEVTDALDDNLNALIDGHISIEEFTEAMEKVTAETRDR